MPRSASGKPSRRVEFVCEPDVETLADRTMMRVLLPNLLENAWKYSSRVEHARIEFGCRNEATVAGIIDLHGGRIRAESAPGAGAAFYFTLHSESHADEEPAPPSHTALLAEQPDIRTRRRLA